VQRERRKFRKFFGGEEKKASWRRIKKASYATLKESIIKLHTFCHIHNAAEEKKFHMIFSSLFKATNSSLGDFINNFFYGGIGGL
jgi:hypothetical protein